MKKIVATVLAMVMALALCTTAFAAPSVYAGAAVGTTTYTPDDGVVMTLEKFATGTESAKVFDTYKLWYTTTKTGAKVQVAGTGEYFLATSASYDLVFVNGNTVTYLLNKTTAGTWDDTAKFVNVAKADSAAKAACGAYYSLTAATTVIEYKDNAYDGVKSTDTNTKVLNIDGKAALINAATTAAGVVYKSHTYSVDTATVAGKVTVTKVTCDDCKASFEFVLGSVTDATVKFGAGNFETVKNANGGDYTVTNGTTVETLFVKTGSGSPNTPNNNGTTTSPKTFDAGIAMYVGMALTSVAGSAVVIGKKKEF